MRKLCGYATGFLPKTACGFEDKRVNMYYQDGMKFIRRHTGEYDLIIVDSTDPFGPGEGLFTKEFYGNCYNALKEDGIMVNQHESPFYEEDAAAMKRAHKRIYVSFPISKVYQSFIPHFLGTLAFDSHPKIIIQSMTQMKKDGNYSE
jgi:spermidine synthase